MNPEPTNIQPSRPKSSFSAINIVHEASAAGWRYFDKIYCVSLYERPDRRDMARRQFEQVGLLSLVEFMVVKKHDGNRERGIFKSHMDCLARGLEARAENILIFEDDILFKGFDPTVLNRCVDFMAADFGWEAFFFGCLVRKITPTADRSVVRVVYRSLAHAYAVRRPFAEKLVSQGWQAVPFDSMLADLCENCYAAYPGFAFQSDAPSNNRQRRGLERFRNLCGGLRRIQKANEFYHYHKTAIILGHLAVVLAILILVFFSAHGR